MRGHKWTMLVCNPMAQSSADPLAGKWMVCTRCNASINRLVD